MSEVSAEQVIDASVTSDKASASVKSDAVEMPENNSLTLEEKIRATDPRDYFRTTTFQKRAREIDTDAAHPWEIASDRYIWSSEPDVEVAAAVTYDQEQRKENMLIAARSGEETLAAYITDLDPVIQDFSLQILQVVAQRYPPETRIEFVRTFISQVQQLQALSSDRAAFELTSWSLTLLPDHPTAQREIPTLQLPRVSYGVPEPTEEQRQELQEFFSLVSTKMPPSDYRTKMAEFARNIPFTDFIYGQNFKYIFSDALRWVVATRPDTEIKSYSGESTRQTAAFPVKDLVRRPILPTDDLAAVLSQLPVRQEPLVGAYEFSPRQAEFVDLANVVGGPGVSNWAIVSTSEGRGFTKISEFVQGFQKGTIGVEGSNDPIRVIEINGDFFIGSDGRHRVAAMKALDVPFAPMLVSHAKTASTASVVSS